MYPALATASNNAVAVGGIKVLAVGVSGLNALVLPCRASGGDARGGEKSECCYKNLFHGVLLRKVLFLEGVSEFGVLSDSVNLSGRGVRLVSFQPVK